MKKLLILLMAFGLLTACNNEKGARNDRDSRTNSRDKDNYRDEDDRDKETSDRDKDDRDSRDRDREDDRSNDRNTDDRDTDDRNTSSNWSSSDVNQFVSSCVSEAVKGGMDRTVATNYCECMQIGLEKKYPNSADAANIDIESPSIVRMMKDCLNN